MKFWKIYFILIFFAACFAACNNFFHEMIPPDDSPRITEFELAGQGEADKTHIDENAIYIPWGIEMGMERQTIRRATLSAKAKLLPVTPEYIGAAFPGIDAGEAIERINAAADLGACLKELVQTDSEFKLPALDMPIDFSAPVMLLAIGGRGTVRQYTAHIVVNIIFDSNGGRSMDAHSMHIAYGETIPPPPDPFREAHVFDGWFADAETFNEKWDFENIPVSESITLYAKWKRIYTVSFASNGGDPVPDQNIVEGAAAVEPPEPFNSGSRLGGWYKDDVAFSQPWDFGTDAVTGDITLYAKWYRGNIVAFDANGGDPVPEQTIAAGGKADQPVASRTGYAFGGWYRDNGTFNQQWNFDAVITENIALYAKWTINRYTVSFDTSGGNLINSINDIEHGSTISRPDDPIRSGYKFVTWYADYGGDSLVKFDFSSPITGNVILHAWWVPD